MNAYEVRQAWCLLQVKLGDPCLSALKWFVYHARRYTSARLCFVPLNVNFALSRPILVVATGAMFSLNVTNALFASRLLQSNI